jgi:hypothetical protein
MERLASSITRTPSLIPGKKNEKPETKNDGKKSNLGKKAATTSPFASRKKGMSPVNATLAIPGTVLVYFWFFAFPALFCIAMVVI